MVPPLPSIQKDRIQQFLREGLSTKAIKNLEGVSNRCITKIRTNIKIFGTHTAPRKCKAGRPPTVTPSMRAGLRAFLEARPWSYLEEMQYYIFDDWGKFVAISSVFETLKSMKIDRKVLKKQASERSQSSRDTYTLAVRQHSANMLVYVDESAANENIISRKHGWAPFGLSPRVVKPVPRSERWSVLPAYTINGLLTTHIQQGAVTAAKFESWLINEVLPTCSPFPGPNSVLVMDNASIHRSADVVTLCREAGVLLLYLPPCSPDLNPNEELFSVVKKWMKKNFEAYENMPFEEYLHIALEACSAYRFAVGHFKHAGVSVD